MGLVSRIALLRKIQTVTVRKSYIKWKDKDRFKVGDYSLENGNAALIKKFHQQFPGIKKSTVETFEQKVEKNWTDAAK